MFDVDAVITWVDGSDPRHKAQRAYYLKNAQTPLHDNGTNPHRWVCSDELNYCLRSIGNNAPWIRRIWIVTDNQHPDMSALPADLLAKTSIVDHREIFRGYDAALPTFNSLSIETMLWRIPGLSEHFLYFNDDVFLTAPVTPADFFAENGPVLRGKWVDYSALAECGESRGDASLLHQYNQINAAEIIGYSASHLFESAHVVHPMQYSVMAALFESYAAECERNASYRFRDTEQYLPQSLYNHACLASGDATILDTRDYLHVAVGALDAWSVADVHAYLGRAERHEIKFLCVNDLPEVERKFPDVRAWIDAAIGGLGDAKGLR
jgi:Stealth protein CR2, conserved region 2/Stealth protein CR1, conserved region 1